MAHDHGCAWHLVMSVVLYVMYHYIVGVVLLCASRVRCSVSIDVSVGVLTVYRSSLCIVAWQVRTTKSRQTQNLWVWILGSSLWTQEIRTPAYEHVGVKPSNIQVRELTVVGVLKAYVSTCFTIRSNVVIHRHRCVLYYNSILWYTIIYYYTTL